MNLIHATGCFQFNEGAVVGYRIAILYATVKMFYHIKEWPDCSLASCLLHNVSFCHNWLKNQYGIDILNKRVSLFDA